MEKTNEEIDLSSLDFNIQCDTGEVCGEDAVWVLKHSCGFALFLCDVCLEEAKRFVTSDEWGNQYCECGVGVGWDDLIKERL